MALNKITIFENIIGNLTLDIKKLFDKGEIEKLYEKMYNASYKLAIKETEQFKIDFFAKYEEKRYVDGDHSFPLHITEILEYRNNRIQFHLEQMFKLLELYAKSKTNTP